ncbi:hypothetical protein R3W88_032329 [Solanum pinnatisectum]|uniref:Uncharacterized protein n=1 Tax=Solanum pinnatisectum TaxID=50273 RepID=A0AAV9LQ58_9SOLN|nr:hypothetical protein R3W88_032329 [Solanum pinnatisectum]
MDKITSRFMFFCSVFISLLIFQAMAEKSETSLPFPRKLTIRRVTESSIANPPLSKDRIAELFEEGENEIVEGPSGAEASAPEDTNNLKIRHHHSADKSVAGGEVIIGGLVTAIFAAVYCYIRITRKKENM